MKDLKIGNNNKLNRLNIEGELYSIEIGDSNKIKKSSFGIKNKYSSIFWVIFLGIISSILGSLALYFLGL